MDPLVLLLVGIGLLAIIVLIVALAGGRRQESTLEERLDQFVEEPEDELTDQEIEAGSQAALAPCRKPGSGHQETLLWRANRRSTRPGKHQAHGDRVPDPEPGQHRSSVARSPT